MLEDMAAPLFGLRVGLNLEFGLGQNSLKTIQHLVTQDLGDQTDDHENKPNRI